MADEGEERGSLLLMWQVHLLAQDAGRAVLLVGATLALLPLLYLVLGHVLGALLLWIAVAVSLSPVLLPAAYALYENGVLVQQGLRGRFRPWAYFARYSVDGGGIFLSPCDTPHRLEAFRGVYLRAAGNKETILEIVRAHLDMEIPGEMWYTRWVATKADEHDRPESSPQG